ncbi:MAG: hypothetical protein KC448_09995 [Yoonia sp.]|nr:hypothetical protein [Yoonia sp.]
MTWLYIIVSGLLALGSGIAFYEWRRGRPFTIERIDDEAETEATRIEDAIAARTYLDLTH